jgi:hypothetical protein
MSEDYFNLKFMCYESAADGVETDYYTIIKAQMREQMVADKNVTYWLDDDDDDMKLKKKSIP